MRRKKHRPAITCGQKVTNDIGQEIACPGVPTGRAVTLHYGEGKSIVCCRAVVCANVHCRRPFKDKNGHTILMGPHEPKTHPKFWTIPYELHGEDWKFYYKFAWEIQLALDANHLETDLYADELIFKMNLRAAGNNNKELAKVKNICNT